MDATPAGAAGKKTVTTADLYVDRVPAQEWAQIFDEVWRRYRDFFYAPNMHGYDWEALREQYKPLLEHVAHRTDLNYVISEMISELTVQHAYIDGGDMPSPPRPHVALPGRAIRARQGVEPLQDRHDLRRAERRGHLPLAADRDRRRREGRRLRARHQRRGPHRQGRPVPPAPQCGGQSGRADAQLHAHDGGRARGLLPPDHRRERSSSISTGSRRIATG